MIKRVMLEPAERVSHAEVPERRSDALLQIYLPNNVPGKAVAKDAPSTWIPATSMWETKIVSIPNFAAAKLAAVATW